MKNLLLLFCVFVFFGCSSGENPNKNANAKPTSTYSIKNSGSASNSGTTLPTKALVASPSPFPSPLLKSAASEVYKPISPISTSEEKLVFLDSNKAPQADNIDVKRVGFLLNYLAENTTTPRSDIADITSRSVTMLEKNFGKRVKHQEFLEKAKQLLETLPSKKIKKEDYKMISYLIYTNLSTN